MVYVMKGILVECDPSMKQFLLHLDETNAFKKKFIIEDLDETHLFIAAEMLEVLQTRIDDLMDMISFPLAEKTMADKRESNRVKDANQRKIMDEAMRNRRRNKALEMLEQDNFQEDPHANLTMHKNAPKFEETLDNKKRRSGKLKTEPFKQRFKKNFPALLEEESQYFTKDKPNYMTAKAPPSKYPSRHFCAVCGFRSNYTCVQCGTRFCCIKCQDIHKDTRCMKWTA